MLGNIVQAEWDIKPKDSTKFCEQIPKTLNYSPMLSKILW